MDDQQRFILNEMIKANDVEDQTGKIRELKSFWSISKLLEDSRWLSVATPVKNCLPWASV